MHYLKSIVYICIMNADHIKEYIKSRPALKQRVLAKQIGWDYTSFNNWYNGRRGIPEPEAIKLREVLMLYGLQPHTEEEGVLQEEAEGKDQDNG